MWRALHKYLTISRAASFAAFERTDRTLIFTKELTLR